jgi:hypothetical protein
MDQAMYDGAMEANADEEARINGKSASDVQEMNSYMNKRSKETIKNSTNQSHITGSSYFGNQALPRKPMTSQDGRTMRMSTVGSPNLTNVNQMRGTFSRAGGPRIRAKQNDIIDVLSSKSLY